MSRLRCAFVHKILTTSAVATLLLCAPMQLVAQEREAQTARQVSALERFSDLWSDLMVWLAGEATQGGCAVDPNGCPRSKSALEGGCAVDPNGGCREEQ